MAETYNMGDKGSEMKNGHSMDMAIRQCQDF